MLQTLVPQDGNRHSILGDIHKERERADATHGVQRSYPPASDPDCYTSQCFTGTRMSREFLLKKARYHYAVAVKQGTLTWMHVLDEEYREVAVEAERLASKNPEASKERLKQELVQVAAVAVAWLEDLHRQGF